MEVCCTAASSVEMLCIDVVYFNFRFRFIMIALRNRADHRDFALWFLLLLLLSSFFFPRLISAVADWMSAILPQTVWP